MKVLLSVYKSTIQSSSMWLGWFLYELRTEIDTIPLNCVKPIKIPSINNGNEKNIF